MRTWVDAATGAVLILVRLVQLVLSPRRADRDAVLVFEDPELDPAFTYDGDRL